MLVLLFVRLREIPWGVGFGSLQPWQTQREVLTPYQGALPQFPPIAIPPTPCEESGAAAIPCELPGGKFNSAGASALPGNGGILEVVVAHCAP